MYASSAIVYGFEFEYTEELEEKYDEEKDEYFKEELYELLTKLDLTYEEGGYPGNQDEGTLVVGVKRDFHNYVQPFSLEEMETFVTNAKATFTSDKLQEIVDFLGLAKAPELKTHIVSSYS